MHIHIIPNRNSKPAVLLRESYRVGGNVRKRTLANLSKLPMDAVDAIKRILKGEKLVSLEDAFEIVENGSRLHGHVDAVLSAMRQLGFEKLVGSRHSRERDLVMAMVAARILEPQSKLATSLWWHTTTLPEILGVSDADEDDLYAAMDWVLERQEVIEKKLAARHLQNDGLALYDHFHLFQQRVVALPAFTTLPVENTQLNFSPRQHRVHPERSTLSELHRRAAFACA